MVYGPRAGVGTWLAIGLTTAMVLAPAILVLKATALARPAPAPASEPFVISSSAPEGRLDSPLFPLPIVVATLPDSRSEQVSVDYAGLRERDPGAALKMFMDAWASLDYEPSGGAAVTAFGRYLTSPPIDPHANIKAEVHEFSVDAFLALTSDPLNVDRLNNAAVALFDLGVTTNLAPTARSDLDAAASTGSIYEGRAIRLFNEIENVDAFTFNRVLLLNHAYLQSVLPSACGPSYTAVPTALAPAFNLLGADLTDPAALLIAADLMSRDVASLSDGMLPGHSGQADIFTSAVDAADHLGQSGLSPALALATRGDVYLAAASVLKDQSPHESHAYALQARTAYATSLSMVRDPGVLAGEARALDLLGERSAALSAQSAAVALEPDSVPLLLDLAAEQEANSDFSGMRSTARNALSLAVQNQDVLLRETRLVTSAPVHGDRGYLGYSYGSDRERTPVYYRVPGCGGGGFSTSDEVPAVDDPYINDRLNGMPEPDAATLASIRASLLLSDPDAAAADVAVWRQGTGNNPNSTQDAFWLGRLNYLSGDALQGVYVAAGRALPPGVDPVNGLLFAESHLRHAAFVSGQSTLFSRAAQLCMTAAQRQGVFAGTSNPAQLKMYGLSCAGESAYFAGDYRTAASALQGDYALDQSPQTATEAAVVLWREGNVNAAHDLLIQAVSSTRTSSDFPYAAEEVLGEIALDQGEPSAALDPFAEVLASVSDSLSPFQKYSPGIGVARSIAAHAFNNHGIALLWRAQRAPDAPPDCAAYGGACKQARDDFGNALSIDPSNPLFLQNVAWADQLMHRLPDARTELTAAASQGSDEYPVRNDLGVMLAEMGQVDAAQRNFEAALRARPDYDLAAWNLGVLLMQEGPQHSSLGQAYLARAVRENPRLRGNPTEYKFDNRFYRAVFGGPLQPAASGVGVAFSQGAEATGAIAAVSALDDVLNVEIKHKLVDFLHLRLAFLMALPARVWLRMEQTAIGSAVNRMPAWARTWSATGLILALVTTFGVLLRPTHALGTEIVIGLFAAAMAVLVHETGHLIGACVAGIRLRPAASPLGIVASVLFVPLRSSIGPYPGHETFPGTAIRVARWVYLAGPAANLLAAALMYGFFMAQPLPFLRLMAGVQLAAAGFSLMPFEPLDGAALGRPTHERAGLFSLLPLAFALVAGLGGAALTLGRL